MMKDLARRIDRLYSGSGMELQRVLHLIESGAYWDELTDEEKDAYCRYKGDNRQVKEQFFEAYASVTGQDLSEVQHELLEKNPTPEEQKSMAEELERWVNEYAQWYNSPEEVAKRKAEYEELQRIGELRRMDFLCGRNMDECHPLPWQNK